MAKLNHPSFLFLQMSIYIVYLVSTVPFFLTGKSKSKVVESSDLLCRWIKSQGNKKTAET